MGGLESVRTRDIASGSAAKNISGMSVCDRGLSADERAAAAAQERVHRRRRQRVVLDDVVVADADGAEHEHRQQAGAVLAGRAVEHRRAGRRRAASRRSGRRRTAGRPRRASRCSGRAGSRRPARPRAAASRSHVLSITERWWNVTGYVSTGKRPFSSSSWAMRRSTTVRSPYGRSTLDVVARQAIEPVGAEQRAPADRAPVGRRVAAEVPEVEDPGEGDAAGRAGDGGCRVHAAEGTPVRCRDVDRAATNR